MTPQIGGFEVHLTVQCQGCESVSCDFLGFPLIITRQLTQLQASCSAMTLFRAGIKGVGVFLLGKVTLSQRLTSQKTSSQDPLVRIGSRAYVLCAKDAGKADIWLFFFKPL